MLLGVYLEGRPELQLESRPWREVGRVVVTYAAGDFAAPVVWFADDVELRCGFGVPDAPRFDFEGEETESFVRDLVQPVHGSSVLIREALSDPNDGDGLEDEDILEGEGEEVLRAHCGSMSI